MNAMSVLLDMVQRRLERLTSFRDQLKKELPEKYREKIINEKFSSVEFPLKVESLRELKAAVIMDRFSLECYAPECNVFELTPTHWQREIEEFQPDLLLIESAWEGKDRLWYKKIANGSKELFQLASFCHEKKIPVIFWNKEDPVYTNTFMEAAGIADVIFTTDVDCIARYKQCFQHDRVYHLHFAAQPKIHNPIEKYERKDAFCFAGAYYHRYKERSETFDAFSAIFIKEKGLEIYDRNYKVARPEHAFPDQYQPYILGSLPSERMDIAYKGYLYGVNMNSVRQSQTMFARRVFEMMASNTVTVGNYSRGLKNYFGDLTICTDDIGTLQKSLPQYCGTVENLRKYRLLALRKVLQAHLYEDRLDYIVEKVFQKKIKPPLPSVILLAILRNDEQGKRLIAMFKKQSYSKKHLVLIGKFEKRQEDADGVTIISAVDAENCALTKLCKTKNSWIGIWDGQDYYGENYLLDLILTTRYGDFCGIGKSCRYYFKDNAYVLEQPEGSYKKANQLAIRCGIFKMTLFQEKIITEIVKMNWIVDAALFGIDEFNYCKGFSASACVKVDDLFVPDQGIALSFIEQAAARIQVKDTLTSAARPIIAKDVFKKIHAPQDKNVVCALEREELSISSTLPEDQHVYLYVEEFLPIESSATQKVIAVGLSGVGNLNLTGVCVFLGQDKKKLSYFEFSQHAPESAVITNEVKYIKLGFRIKGSGQFRFREFLLNHSKEALQHEQQIFLARSNVLVLTNQYPAPENLYRNMFVHQRLLSYKEEGKVYDVMRLNVYAKKQYREYEGIDVAEGQSRELAEILETGAIETVCVHFLDEMMWEVLRQFGKEIKIIVWVHGAEIQPWWRRSYNYKTEKALTKAKEESEIRMAFWKEIFDRLSHHNLHFVFVSNYFAEEVFEDYNMTLPATHYSIIHNYVNENVFVYGTKDAEKRLKILAIKSFSSAKYANDLMCKVILALSNKRFFSNLSIAIYGDGELFEEEMKPLKNFKNVDLQRKFLRHAEIAQLHKEYGVFLSTTRWDSQGVSRDEAMASGLIPVTNAVAAIPEFVNDACGILAPAEDYQAMAAGIERLYHDPAFFSALSKNAAARVRVQSGRTSTVIREIALIVDKEEDSRWRNS